MRAADPQTESEVFNVLQQFNDAVGRRDLEATLKLFMPGDQVTVVASELGSPARGSDEVRALFEGSFSGPIGYFYRWEESHVSLCNDVALVFLTGWLGTTSMAGTHEHHYRMTGVLCRHESNWVFAQYHGSEQTA